MVFNSIAFVVFFAIVCSLCGLTSLPLIQKLCDKHLLTVRHSILLIASYIFYGWWDWRFAFLMLGLTAIAYLCSLWLKRTGKKAFLYLGVIIPLLALGVFKYFNFFIDSFVDLFHIQNVATLNIILPVGISFYTFQSLSYTLDVHRGNVKMETSFLKVALYISFFPQLVAGPIVKANDFLPQLYEDRNITWKGFQEGIQIFAFGLFKKIVLADQISVCVDTVFNSPTQFNGLSLLMAVVAYSIQIYCDFSGYSDMAIGCAKCLGYDLMRNFNMPYISRNISEFWKRWHISLSTWLMEYLYFPLGGNRKGTTRTYINLFLTMLIGGLWHGAAWTFVAWGALHGLALCVHKIWMKITRHDKHYKGTFFGNLFSGVITYGFVLLCWVFFRANTFTAAWQVIKGICTWQSGILYVSSWTILGIVLVGTFTLIAYLRSRRNQKPAEGYYPLVNLNSIWGMTLVLIAFGLALGLAYTGSNPFIYFQF